MTRKQLFEMLATALHRTAPDYSYAPGWCVCWTETCIAVADELEKHNPTFDRARFLADCRNGPKKES